MGDVKGNCVVRWCKRERQKNNIQNRKKSTYILNHIQGDERTCKRSLVLDYIEFK